MWGKIILVKLLSAEQKSSEGLSEARKQILDLKRENANLQSMVSLSFGFALALLCFYFALPLSTHFVLISI